MGCGAIASVQKNDAGNGTSKTKCNATRAAVSNVLEKGHVASMSRGVSGNVWEALKINGNFS
jgi:hypothetical protein